MEKARIEVVKFLEGKVPKDASWQDLYNALLALDNPYVAPAHAATEWLADEMTFGDGELREYNDYPNERVNRDITEMLTAKGGLPAEKQLPFRTYLLCRVIKELQHKEKELQEFGGRGEKHIFLSVDYEPYGLLDEVKRQLSLGNFIFPFKTVVCVATDEVVIGDKTIYKGDSSNKELN